jgi:hypothetical protein
MKRKCTELLTKEHKVILRIADVLVAIAEESEQKTQLNREDVLAILEILRLSSNSRASSMFGRRTADIRFTPSSIGASRVPIKSDSPISTWDTFPASICATNSL